MDWKKTGKQVKKTIETGGPLIEQASDDMNKQMGKLIRKFHAAHPDVFVTGVVIVPRPREVDGQLGIDYRMRLDLVHERPTEEGEVGFTLRLGPIHQD